MLCSSTSTAAIHTQPPNCSCGCLLSSIMLACATRNVRGLSAAALALLILIFHVLVLRAANGLYLVGTGIADITGPAADVNLMGYANAAQIAAGIHFRLYARAFIVADSDASERRWVFVNMDACMASQLVTIHVIRKLKESFGNLYTEDNVALSGTHTHASSAGFLQYVIYDITSLGFVRQSFDVLVDGVVQSIQQAHDRLAPGHLRWAAGELLDANINRSPTAYLANPQTERDLYEHDVAKEMELLRFDDEQGRGMGLISWFAVHCTSMNNTNPLLSGDNKGAAELLMEDWAAACQMKQEAVGPGLAAQVLPTAVQAAQQAAADQHAGAVKDGFGAAHVAGAAAGGADVMAPCEDTTPGFVAAFAQGSVGDTSPNTEGPFCIDTGLSCDNEHSTCNGYTQMCHGRGPNWPDDTASTLTIGDRQFKRARELYTSAQEDVAGPVDFRHKFLDMTNITVVDGPFTRAGRTCRAAMGFSFAAGTTDGPGQFDFTQGNTNGTAFWRLVSKFLHNPTQQQIDCHAPKPILIDSGNMHLPYDWQPSVTEISIFRAGQVVILSVPGELTTMAGRRLRHAVRETVRHSWGDVHVVIAGLTNTYSSYVTTFEEYQVQRYEGAFTIYGPHTLDAYIQEFVHMAQSMIKGAPVLSTARPPDLYSRQISLLPPVIFDRVPWGSKFGDVIHDAKESYKVGDVVEVTFRSGCPRNNLRTNATFVAVERLVDSNMARMMLHATAQQPYLQRAAQASAEPQGPQESGQEDEQRWTTVYTDRDWCTKFLWSRPFPLSPESSATVRWEIPPGGPLAPATYRLRHFGDSRSVLGHVTPYEGASRPFVVQWHDDKDQIGGR